MIAQQYHYAHVRFVAPARHTQGEMASSLKVLQAHTRKLRACEQCPDMIGPVVTGTPVVSPVMLLGQAPGTHEGRLDKPFAWTAGKTMFSWFSDTGIDEETFRANVFMAAVCRCFPGKNPKGGDRVPNKTEIANCASWLDREIDLIRPKLILPVGKLAIGQLMKVGKLTEVVGQVIPIERNGHKMDAIPLPHPSGASTWHRMEPGIALLQKALRLVAQHPAFVRVKR
jgi:uracil-DNA glycosylase